MPRRTFPLLVFLALLAAAPARGEGINLAWNNCASGPGAADDLSFACDDESRVMVLVGSFIAPGGISTFIGMDASIQIVTDGNMLPDFWQLGTDGCRSTAGNPQFSSPGMSGCTNPWGSQFLGLWNFSTQDVPSGRGHMRVDAVRPANIPIPLSTGREYFAFQFRLAMEGASTCTGCKDGACIVMNSITVYQPTEVAPPLEITVPATRNYVTWQGGGVGCQAAGSKATKKVTWGQIKGKYR